MAGNALFLLNLLATWYMVGLIWMVQIVHYKMFDRVGEDAFARYAIDHAKLITPIVAIPMLIEIVTAAGLLAIAPDGMSRSILWIAFVLVLAAWASTAILQVPCHNQLASGFDNEIYRKLVSTNWIRTIAWSLRGAILAVLCWQLLSNSVAQ